MFLNKKGKFACFNIEKVSLHDVFKYKKGKFA